MLILGIDPGATTGWCFYNSEARAVIASGQFPEYEIAGLPTEAIAATAVVERPKGYGPTRPQLVDCGYVCGRIVEALQGPMEMETYEMLRLDVCRALTDAMHGVMRVRNDATAWAALLELHGGPLAAKKGGPLYGVKSHGRAALAVAVAFAMGTSQDV